MAGELFEMEKQQVDPKSSTGISDGKRQLPASPDASSIVPFERSGRDSFGSSTAKSGGAEASSDPDEKPRWYDLLGVGFIGIISCAIMILGFWKLYELLFWRWRIRVTRNPKISIPRSIRSYSRHERVSRGRRPHHLPVEFEEYGAPGRI